MRLRTFLGYGGVLLAALQLSCHTAPTPAPEGDPYAEAKALMRQSIRQMDQDNAAMERIICQAHGILGSTYVESRDTQQEPLEVVLARIDKVDQSDPHTKAMGDRIRQVAIQVYAHPAWTAADAFTYALEECLRERAR